MSKFFLLIPLLLLTACSARLCDTNAKSGPTFCGNRTASPQEARTATRRAEVQSTPSAAVLMGENSTLATPDANATQAALNNQIEDANNKNFELQNQLIELKNANHAIDARIKEAEAAKARDILELAKEQNAAPVELEKAKLAAIEAENKRLQLLIDLARAETDRDQGVVKTAALLAFCAVMIGFMLLAHKAMNRPHVIADPVVVEDETEEEETEPTPAPSDEYDDLPPGIDTNTMRTFMIYATTGKPLGAESMGPMWGTSPAQRAKRNSIMAHLEKHGHVERYAGAKRLNVAGEIIWKVWMKANPPTAKRDAENAENTLHGSDLHGRDAGAVGEL